MKTLIVYTSIHHGNTEKIGKAMAEVLKADVIKTEDMNVNILKDYDLIGFGSGVYGGKLHKTIVSFIENMPNTSNKKAFVFSTSSLGKTKYNNSIEEKLKEKGFSIVGSFACKGFDTFGPFKLIGGLGKGRPNAEDIQNAKDFAKGLEK
jgi:flavodoxin